MTRASLCDSLLMGDETAWSSRAFSFINNDNHCQNFNTLSIHRTNNCVALLILWSGAITLSVIRCQGLCNTWISLQHLLYYVHIVHSSYATQNQRISLNALRVQKSCLSCHGTNLVSKQNWLKILSWYFPGLLVPNLFPRLLTNI